MWLFMDMSGVVVVDVRDGAVVVDVIGVVVVDVKT